MYDFDWSGCLLAIFPSKQKNHNKLNNEMIKRKRKKQQMLNSTNFSAENSVQIFKLFIKKYLTISVMKFTYAVYLVESIESIHNTHTIRTCITIVRQ